MLERLVEVVDAENPGPFALGLESGDSGVLLIFPLHCTSSSFWWRTSTIYQRKSNVFRGAYSISAKIIIFVQPSIFQGSNMSIIIGTKPRDKSSNLLHLSQADRVPIHVLGALQN